ncbi:MAG: tetraacyldisaccharide 4'-kinase [Alphaproteobacteria bacterium]|jgi:tetraacyldisaccharide 4'-kinase|nr:tetraacyldisaccharide 4'-kinase [Alphaproteobacteria bacterium]
MLFKNLNFVEFWQKKSPLNYLLLPLSGLWWILSQLRKLKPVYEGKLFVICLGNLNLGGSGKTPTAILLGRSLRDKNPTMRIAFLSKGYGGKLKNVWVDVNKHRATEVGDEPLLLAQHLPTLVCSNMIDGLKTLETDGFQMVITDDGFQNPTIKKDFNILVVNGYYGFGNGLLFPAGSLRESISSGLKKANTMVMLERSNKKIKKLAAAYQFPILSGEYVPISGIPKKDEDVLAFCGIGIPKKFKKTLRKYHIKVEEFITFPDHYAYTAADIDNLIKRATDKNLTLLTTQKDYVKIPLQSRAKILSFNIELQLTDLQLLLEQILKSYEEKNN